MCEVASVRLSLRLDEGEEGGGVRGKERGERDERRAGDGG